MSDSHPTDPRPGKLAPNPVAKTCEYGHHYYTGTTCPLCEYLGKANLQKAFGGSHE